MVKEIKEEIRRNIRSFLEKTRQLSIALISRAISTGMMVETLAIGLGAFVYITKPISKVNQKIMPAHIRWIPREEGYVQSSRTAQKRINLRNELRETANTVTELKRLARGFESLTSH